MPTHNYNFYKTEIHYNTLYIVLSTAFFCKILNNRYIILILDQPIDKLSAIISSFSVKLPCQATACLRLLSLTELILSVDFVYRTIEN